MRGRSFGLPSGLTAPHSDLISPLCSLHVTQRRPGKPSGRLGFDLRGKAAVIWSGF